MQPPQLLISFSHFLLHFYSQTQILALRICPNPYFLIMYCPHCHSELKDNATFCPHCGSDKNTGWKEGAEFSDLDLPDYDEIVENEFGDDPNSPYAKKKTANPFGIIVVTIVVIAFVSAMIL